MPDRPDTRAEVHALARLAFDELGRVPHDIGDVHHAIANRAFWGVNQGVGPAVRPVQLAHDAISAGVYGALRGSAGLLGRATGAALERTALDRPPPSSTRRGSIALGALQGLIGDALVAEGSPLAQPLRIMAPAAATPRIAVFLHGLMETESAWQLGGGPSYGDRLLSDLGFTPVYVRYNSGLHISDNGRLLAERLDAMVSEWAADVEEIALIGHSMGGLVARSACHQAGDRGAHWVSKVRYVVSLGTPHMGAPLEQAVHHLSARLHSVPETRPVARFLRRRSAGIRDLRQGSLVDEDWRGRDPDALRAAACREVPLLDGATHCFVSATVTRSPKHPVGRLVGDLLVLVPSASGRSRSRRLAFRAEDGLHLGGATHFALLNHPAVYGRLREWLAPASADAGGGAPPCR